MITKFLVFWVLTQSIFVSVPGSKRDDYGRTITDPSSITLVKSSRQMQNVKSFNTIEKATEFINSYPEAEAAYKTDDLCNNFKIDSVQVDTNKIKDLSVENLVKIYKEQKQ